MYLPFPLPPFFILIFSVRFFMIIFLRYCPPYLSLSSIFTHISKIIAFFATVYSYISPPGHVFFFCVLLSLCFFLLLYIISPSIDDLSTSSRCTPEYTRRQADKLLNRHIYITRVPLHLMPTYIPYIPVNVKLEILFVIPNKFLVILKI